jgi:major membrane immunogen (membrane-anchored lipoprotein)
MYKSSIFAILLSLILNGCSTSDFSTPTQENSQNQNMGYIKIYSKYNRFYTIEIDNKKVNIQNNSYSNNIVPISISSGTKSIKIYDIKSNLIYLSKRYVGSGSSITIKLP